MIYWLDFIRLAHVLGACVLIGTGAGIAFFMLMAHRTEDATTVAATARIVVIADYLFTATAAIAQPVTGVILALGVGWPLTEGWLLASIGLYILIGAFWLPVLVIQKRMRDDAAASAQSGSSLSPRYHRLFRIWFVCGIPAFAAIIALLWLMLVRPALG